MNSFIRGLGGGIGRVFGRVIAIIIVGVIGYFILNSLDFDLWSFISSRILMDAKAQTQNRDMGNMIYSGLFSPCGLSYNKYCVQTSSNQTLTRNLNTTYNGVLLDISFSWQETSSYQTTITINGMSSDFRNNNFTCNVWGSTQQDTYGTVMSSASCSFISKSKLQVVIPQNSYSYHTIHIWGSPLTGVSNYGIKSIVETWDDGQQDLSSITDNASENTQDIIENANNNTQDIINTVSHLFQDCYENILNKSNYTIDNNQRRYNVDFVEGEVYTIISNENFGYKISNATWGYADSQSSLVSNVYTFTYQKNPNNTGVRGLYVYFSGTSVVGEDLTNKEIMVLKGSVPRVSSYVDFQQNVCSNKLEEETWWMQEIKNSADETNQTIKDSNIDNGLGSSFFSDFQDNDFGLSNIITLPITTIQSLTSQTCVPLQIPVPFTQNGRITLPCMQQVYESNVPQLYVLWQVVCYGLIGYWIGTDIFRLVKGFKNPDEDKVEVMDL